MKRLVAGALFMLCTSWGILAQTATPSALDGIVRAYFVADNLSPALGQPFQLTLVVELPPRATLVEFPELTEESWGDFMIRQRGDVFQERLDDGSTRITQSFTMILWEPGDFETDELLVGYLAEGEDDLFYAPFTNLFFTVPSMLNPDMNQNELRPLKPQLTFFYVPLWFSLSSVVVGVLFVWYVRRRWIAYQKYRASLQPDSVVISPAEQALSTLSRLMQDESMPQVLIDKVNVILRTFIAAEYEINALEMTASELARLPFLPEQEMLSRILNYGDLIKYADVQPDSAKLEQYVEQVAKWIRVADGESMPLDSVEMTAAS